MSEEKASIFNYLDFRCFVEDRLRIGGRGTQSKLSKAMNCQATYLIRVLKGDASMTEDQAFRCGRFLQLTSLELDFFLDLVRKDRAVDPEAKKYIESGLEKKSKAAQNIKNRIESGPVEHALDVQLRYYSRWEPAIIHLATSCENLQTPSALAERFRLSETQIFEILKFLNEIGLVRARSKDRYEHSGKSIHLEKESPLHPVFQKVRRELALHLIGESRSPHDLRFSSAFATSKSHQKEMREVLLDVIQRFQKELKETESEEVSLLVLDFCQLS